MADTNNSEKTPLDKPLEKICYPTPNRTYCEKISSKMTEIGLTVPQEPKIIGKGWASIVILVYHDKMKTHVAAKIRRTDSRRSTLIREAVYATIASKYGISPKVYYADKDIIVMEPVFGPKLTIIKSSKEKCRYIVKRLLWKTYILDRLGISHNELAIPYGHILLDTNLEPYIIDYESATFKQKPKNTTQVIGALIRMKPPCITTKLENIVILLKRYKEKQNLENHAEILAALLH